MEENIKAYDVSLLNKYTTELMKIGKEVGLQDGEFWYRGQRNAEWPIRSGAIDRIAGGRGGCHSRESIKRCVIENYSSTLMDYRTLFPDQDFCMCPEVEELIVYHKNLLESAKLIGGNWNISGRELRDLELLAQLQHYGAATCLLDMTSSFNIALWFACQEVEEKEADGKVFIVPIDSASTQINFLKVRSDELDEAIDYFLDPKRPRKEENTEKQISNGAEQSNNKKPKFWCWEPRTFLMGRMLSQASRFIFSSCDISQKGKLYHEIEIAAEDKKGLLLELELQQGLKPQNIFSDIPGLASVNARGMPHQLKHYKYYLKKGKEKILEGNFEDAIQNFNQADKLKPNDLVILLERIEARKRRANELDGEQSWEELEQAREDLKQARDLIKEIKNWELQNKIKYLLNEIPSSRIPPMTDFLRPILQWASRRSDGFTLREATDAMVSHFELSSIEKGELTEKGNIDRVYDRTSWAINPHLKEAGLVRSMRRGRWIITAAGKKEIRASKEMRMTTHYLADNFPSYRRWREEKKRRSGET